MQLPIRSSVMWLKLPRSIELVFFMICSWDSLEVRKIVFWKRLIFLFDNLKKQAAINLKKLCENATFAICNAKIFLYIKNTIMLPFISECSM